MIRPFRLRVAQVVFYSWSSNWGIEHAARISLPDPLTASVVAEYKRIPNGTNAVDYPEVLLMKVLAKSLFQKAPEAYWMFRRLTIDKDKLREMLASSQHTTRQQIEESACAFVKAHTDLIRQVAPECVTQGESELANSDNSFDRGTGTCTHSEVGDFRCFDTVYDSSAYPDRRDRSKTVIRFGQRDWLSHDLMRTIAMILIHEKLGYTVLSEDIANEPSRVAWDKLCCS